MWNARADVTGDDDMALRSLVDEHGVVPIPSQILSATGLKVGDMLVVEHAEPGLIRFRLETEEDAEGSLERLLIEPLGTIVEEGETG